MNIQFIAGTSMITPDPVESRKLYVESLGLPLEASEGDDYLHSEDIGGSKHFGVWPPGQAAQACFETPDWRADRPVPQASAEFEVDDAAGVQAAAQELRDAGYTRFTRRAASHGADGRSARVSGGRDRRLLRSVDARMTGAG